jgi:hypothetical protein
LAEGNEVNISKSNRNKTAPLAKKKGKRPEGFLEKPGRAAQTFGTVCRLPHVSGFRNQSQKGKIS